MTRRPSVLLALLLALAAARILAAPESALTRRTFGQGSIEVPGGWKVESRNEGGLLTLAVRQDPDDGAAPALMAYRLAYDPNQTPEQIIQAMVRDSEGTRITRQEKLPGEEGHLFSFTFPLDEVGGGQGAFLVQARSREQSTLVLALYGSKANFAQSGGPAFLRRVASTFRWPASPAPVATPGKAATPAPEIRTETRVAPPEGTFIRLPEVLSKSSGFPPTDLSGLWGEGQGSVINQVRQRRIDDNTLEEMTKTTGTQGKGRVIRFLPDQRYQWLATTEVSSAGCQSQAAITEVGTYQFDGNILTVTPSGYEGYIAICRLSDRERRKGSGAPVRRYLAYTAVVRQVFGNAKDPTGRALYLVGPCGKHLTDCDSDNQVEIILQRL